MYKKEQIEKTRIMAFCVEARVNQTQYFDFGTDQDLLTRGSVCIWDDSTSIRMAPSFFLGGISAAGNVFSIIFSMLFTSVLILCSTPPLPPRIFFFNAFINLASKISCGKDFYDLTLTLQLPYTVKKYVHLFSLATQSLHGISL